MYPVEESRSTSGRYESRRKILLSLRVLPSFYCLQFGQTAASSGHSGFQKAEIS